MTVVFDLSTVVGIRQLGTNTMLMVLMGVSGTNDALQQSAAKAKSTTHTNWGCLIRPFISILSVDLRQE